MNLRFTEPDPAQVTVDRPEQPLAPAENRTADADAVLRMLSEEARMYRRNRRIQKHIAPPAPRAKHRVRFTATPSSGGAN